MIRDLLSQPQKTKNENHLPLHEFMNYLFRCSRLKHLTVWHRTPHQLYYYHCTATMADWFKASLAPTKALFVDEDSTDEIPFQSRRSPFLCRHACVSTSQPLASSIGLDFLRAGKGNSSKEANAADVAVAVAAALAVTEPCKETIMNVILPDNSFHWNFRS